MCTAMSGARGALLACNIVLMLIAFAFIASGVVLILGRSAYGSELGFLRNDLSYSANLIRGQNDLNVSELDVIFITLPLGVVLLIFGGLITFVTILGIIAASGQFYKFSIVYMTILGCLYFAQVVVIICVYIDRKPFDSTIKKLLKTTLRPYSNINGKDSLTLGWNAIMSYKKCCGVDSYEDFAIANYPRSATFPNGTPYSQVTPEICCIIKTVSGGCVTKNNYQKETYYNYGCYDHIWDYVTSETGLIIFAVFFIVFIEFLCFFFTLWILCFRRRQGISKVASRD